jgi:hypothetical protein
MASCDGPPVSTIKKAITVLEDWNSHVGYNMAAWPTVKSTGCDDVYAQMENWAQIAMSTSVPKFTMQLCGTAGQYMMPLQVVGHLDDLMSSCCPGFQDSNAQDGCLVGGTSGASNDLLSVNV